MLPVYIPDIELFNNATGEFSYIKGGHLVLEHSLVAIHRWESKWKKPYLSNIKKTREESVDYIRCMIVDGSVDDEVLDMIPDHLMKEIDDYIHDPMTATTFADSKSSPPSRNPITAEVIYWQMTVLNIPIEFENRHLNQLLTLIHVCTVKNGPKEKMSKQELYERHRKINEMNKKRFNTRG